MDAISGGVVVVGSHVEYTAFGTAEPTPDETRRDESTTHHMSTGGERGSARERERQGVGREWEREGKKRKKERRTERERSA